MNILVKSGEATTVTTDLLVCFGYEQEKAWSKAIRPIDKKLGGQLNELRKIGEFSGKANQTTLLHINGKLSAKRVLLRTRGMGNHDAGTHTTSHGHGRETGQTSQSQRHDLCDARCAQNYRPT